MSTLAEALASPDPPPPPGEVPRSEHTRLRRRMLYDCAKQDYRERVLRRLQSIERAEAWGDPDPTGNLFTPGCTHLAQLYTPDPPRVGGRRTKDGKLGALPPGGGVLAEAVEEGGLWALMIRGQRDTIGMREWLVRVDAIEDPAATLGWALTFRPAFADRISARPRRDAPDLPGYVAEPVELNVDGECRWWWDVWSVEDEAAPYHEIRSDLGPAGRVIYRAEGGEYPYWDRTGPRPRPVVPYSLYHAERTGHLWDPYCWRVAVEGSLEITTQWTFFGHILLKAAWPQRYSVGVDWGGGTDDGEDAQITVSGAAPMGGERPRKSTPSDPAAVLQGVPTDDGTGQFTVAQWALSADPEKIAGAISLYERRVAAIMGINPADIQRVTGDPRSGYAIEISREAQEEARERFRPAFRRGDLETLRVAAAVLGSAAGVDLPSSGYDLDYGPVDESAVAAGAAEGAVQDTALNGAQVDALVSIVQAVAAGQLPRDAAGAIIERAFAVDASAASALLGSAGRGFKIEAPSGPGGQDGGRAGSGGADPEDGGGEGRGEGGGGGTPGEGGGPRGGDEAAP